MLKHATISTFALSFRDLSEQSIVKQRQTGLCVLWKQGKHMQLNFSVFILRLSFS